MYNSERGRIVALVTNIIQTTRDNPELRQDIFNTGKKNLPTIKVALMQPIFYKLLLMFMKIELMQKDISIVCVQKYMKILTTHGLRNILLQGIIPATRILELLRTPATEDFVDFEHYFGQVLVQGLGHCEDYRLVVHKHP